jgi:hypothetical protein
LSVTLKNNFCSIALDTPCPFWKICLFLKVPDEYETFAKRRFLFKFKKGDNFNHRNTLSISRINPPKFGGGLKFEPDAEIEQKGAFCKGLLAGGRAYPG